MAVIGFGPLWRVDGPLPIPPLFGLLQAAKAPAAGVQILDDVDGRNVERWLNGIAMYPYSLGDAQTFKGCGVGSEEDEKDFGVDLPQPEFLPMTIYLSETCTSSKVWDQDAFTDRAKLALEAVKGAAVAREFMGGALMSTETEPPPYLSDGNGTFPNGDTATNVVDGLALLEGEIAKSGKQGVIHCTPMMATSLLGRGFALADKTGVIRTINGIVVIPDFGYAQANFDGSKPVGHADVGQRQEWAYATGPLEIRESAMFISPDNVSEALDRGSGGATTGRPNSITYRAEQYFLIAWDLEVQGAVLVDRCLADCGID